MNTTLFTLKDAFKKDIEIMFGYICMGFIFGILLNASGYSALYAFIMSVFIYSGVMQFMAVSFFSGDFSLSSIFVTTLIVNMRQSFYTMIMLKEIRKMDKKKRFLNMFWLTDETLALITTKKPHKQSNKDLFIFFIGMMNHMYWILGCVCGASIGKFIPIDTKGIEFIMTAIFVVIFINQWIDSNDHFPAIIGLIIATIWLLIIGQTYFLLLSILTCILIFVFMKGQKNGY